MDIVRISGAAVARAIRCQLCPSMRWNVAPRSGAASARTRPPWRVTILGTIASRCRCPRTPRSNACAGRPRTSGRRRPCRSRPRCPARKGPAPRARNDAAAACASTARSAASLRRLVRDRFDRASRPSVGSPLCSSDRASRRCSSPKKRRLVHGHGLAWSERETTRCLQR